MKSTFTILALLSAVAGCATTDAPADTQPAPEPKQYRTGSNLPVKDAVPLTPEEKEKQRQDARDAIDKLTNTYLAPRPR